MENIIQERLNQGVLAVYEEPTIPETLETVSTGWLPPMPDFRDYTEENTDIQEMSTALKIPHTNNLSALPGDVDLRQWCSPIENQGHLGSCTANAAVGVVEYFENRAFNRYINGSRLFVYKATRKLMGVNGDTGAWLRTTMGALSLCGVAPEKYWAYTDNKQPGPEGRRTFDEDPPAFVYSVADNFEALRYFCHDPAGHDVVPDNVLTSVKRYLAAGIPSMFGFYGFPSANYTNVRGAFPFPCSGEQAIWGHAVVAVGYDDSKKIKNTKCNLETTGALLIRNSWGTSWGDNGYGWLPYAYVSKRIAMDFWSMLRMGWVNTGQFGLG
jgi:C1A family cysteine protease